MCTECCFGVRSVLSEYPLSASILLVSVLLVVVTLQMRRNFDTFCSCSTIVATMGGGELEGLLSLGWCVVVTGSMGPYLYSCLGLHCHTLEEVVAI